MESIEIHKPRKVKRPHDASAYYLDTSALAKLYVKEDGSRELNAWFGDPRKGFDPDVQLFTSRLGLPQTISAITRKWNGGALGKQSIFDLWHHVVNDFASATPPYGVVEPSEAVVGRAAWLVALHNLRTYDAVHLASALWLQPRLEDPESFVVVCADRKLAKVARAERLRTADPVPPRPPSE
jgi:predicted nucleic acid-binding protein